MGSEAGALCLAIGNPDGPFGQAVKNAVIPVLQSHIGARGDAAALVHWLSADDLQRATRADRGIIGQLASTPLVIIDSDTNTPEIFYLLGAREAFANGVTLVARSGAPTWSLPLCQPRFVDLASPSGTQSVTSAISGLLDRRGQSYASDFQIAQAVQVSPRDPIARMNEGEATLYFANGNSGRLSAKLGIKAGEIQSINDVDAWVNSENNRMQMARDTDRSISATIRHLGARPRGLSGDYTDDATAVALARAMGARQQVQVGDVLVTEAPDDTPLSTVNHVKAVAHVAAVTPAGPGQGFNAGHRIDRCVASALAELEQFSKSRKLGITNVLFPLLGAGDGGAPPEIIASQMVGHLIDVLQRRSHGFTAVYLLAYRQRHKDAILGAFRAHGCEPDPESEVRSDA